MTLIWEYEDAYIVNNLNVVLFFERRLNVVLFLERRFLKVCSKYYYVEL